MGKKPPQVCNSSRLRSAWPVGGFDGKALLFGAKSVTLAVFSVAWMSGNWLIALVTLHTQKNRQQKVNGTAERRRTRSRTSMSHCLQRAAHRQSVRTPSLPPTPPEGRSPQRNALFFGCLSNQHTHNEASATRTTTNKDTIKNKI